MGNRTPLYETHVASGAKIVDFGGWDMPLNYGSQIEEHHAVRRDAGMFDVSHMCPVDVRGGDARAFLRHLVANNVDRLAQPGKALYSCMLNPAGGVVDDLIATGGTARATGELVRRCGAEVAAFVFLIQLVDLDGIEKLAPTPVITILDY